MSSLLFVLYIHNSMSEREASRERPAIERAFRLSAARLSYYRAVWIRYVCSAENVERERASWLLCVDRRENGDTSTDVARATRSFSHGRPSLTFDTELRALSRL